MDKKINLSSINKPVKASEWFSRFDKMPEEILVDQDSVQDIVRRLNNSSNNTEEKVVRLNKPIKAADWFKNNNRIPRASDREAANDIVHNSVNPNTESRLSSNKPEPIDVNIKSVSNTVDLANRQNSLDESKKKKKDDIDRLIESILKLTNELHKNTTEKSDNSLSPNRPKKSNNSSDNKKPLNSKKSDSPKSYKELISSIIKDKTSEVKEMFTVRNALLSQGFDSAMAGSGTILDRVLQFREDKINDRKKESVSGNKLQNKPSTGIFNKVSKFLEKTPIQKYTSGSIVPETNTSLGKVGNDVEKISDRLQQTTNNLPDKILKTPIKSIIDIAKNSSKSGLSKAKEVIGKVVPFFANNPVSKTVPEESKAKAFLKNIHLPNEVREAIDNPSPKNKEVLDEVKLGMRDELVKLNKEQLEELKKLVARLESPTESREDKIENLNKQTQKSESPEKKKEKKEEKSIFKTITDSISSGGKLGKIKNLAQSALRFAGPTLGVAAAGAAGYGVGSLINSQLINPAMEGITGTKGATLGTALYDGVDKVKGWFGNSDADKMREADNKARAVLASGIKKVGTEPIPIKPEETDKIKPSESVPRIQQMERIQTTIRETGKIADLKKTNNKKENNVIDARSNVTNNSTIVQHSRPLVKNPDSTFNNLLSLNFSH